MEQAAGNNRTENTQTILITGATGLLGSHLLKALINRNKKIIALYRSEIPQDFKNVEWIKGDIFDVVLLDEVLKNVQQVYHCAGKVSFNPKQKKDLFKTNVEGTANVVNACINNNVKKLLHVSSVAALGKIRRNVLVNEDMKWSEEANNSIYGQSKYLGEMEVWRGIAEGLNAVIINPSIILGAFNWNNGSTEIFKTVYNEFPYYSDGVTGFVDVNDVVKIMIELMESDIVTERFIVNADNIAYKDLFEVIAKSFNKKPPQKNVTPFMAGMVWRLAAVKSLFTGKTPFITKETAGTALAKIYFDNSKLLKTFPSFHYNSIQNTVERICNELKAINHLD